MSGSEPSRASWSRAVRTQSTCSRRSAQPRVWSTSLSSHQDLVPFWWCPRATHSWMTRPRTRANQGRRQRRWHPSDRNQRRRDRRRPCPTQRRPCLRRRCRRQVQARHPRRPCRRSMCPHRRQRPPRLIREPARLPHRRRWHPTPIRAQRQRHRPRPVVLESPLVSRSACRVVFRAAGSRLSRRSERCRCAHRSPVHSPDRCANPLRKHD